MSTTIDTAALAAEIRQGPEAYGGEITEAEFDALVADGYNPHTGKLVRSTYVDYGDLNEKARKLYDSARQVGYFEGDTEGSSRTAFYHGEKLLETIEQMLNTCKGADRETGHLLSGYAQRLISLTPRFNIGGRIGQVQNALIRSRPSGQRLAAGEALPPLNQREIEIALQEVRAAREEYTR